MTSTFADLIGLAGLLMAVALYAMLLAMVVHQPGRPWRERMVSGDGLILCTAFLGLVWNLGAFGLLSAGSTHAVSASAGILVATTYSALGFLPAVFVDVALQPWGGRLRRSGAVIRISGYGLSTAAL